MFRVFFSPLTSCSFDLESLIFLSFSQCRKFLFLYNWLVAQIFFFFLKKFRGDFSHLERFSFNITYVLIPMFLLALLCFLFFIYLNLGFG